MTTHVVPQKFGLNDKGTYQAWFVSPYALSKALGVLFFLNMFLTGFLVKDISAGQLNVHVVDFIDGLLGGVLIWWIGTFKDFTVSTTRQVLFIWLAISVCVTLTQAAIVQFGTQGTWLSVLKSAPIGVLSNLAVMAAFTGLLGTWSHGRVAASALAQQRIELTGASSNLKIETERITSEILDDVLEQILPALAEISDVLRNFENESQISQANQTITGAINSVVLPMTHQLHDNEQILIADFRISAPLENSDNPTGLWKDILSSRLRDRSLARRSINQLIAPAATLASFGVFLFPYSVLAYGSAGGVSAVLVGALAAIVMRTLLRTNRNWEFPAIAAVPLTAVLVGLPGMLFPFLVDSAAGTTFDPEGFAIFAGLFNIAFIVGFIQSSFVRRYLAIQHAMEVNEHLAAVNSRLRQNIWAVRHKLAKIIHGEIQGSLIAATMKLSTAKETSPALISEIMQDLIGAADSLQNVEDSSKKDFHESLNTIVHGWSGSTVVHTEFDDYALATLRTDFSLRECVLEVCREGITNAVKHAQAREVTIVGQQVGPEHLQISIKNLLSPGLGITSSGYGAQTLDEVTHEWNLHLSDTEVELVATFSV